MEANENTDEALLSDIEARVLGALMEKQMTTPDQYPLTLNSLVTACNQKTSREPVMNLQNGAVLRCINELEQRDMVSIDYGSRADKYQQKLNRVLHLDKQEQAIICLMLLRGAQTVNELFSRSKRMCDFADQNEVQELLDKHLGKLKPMVFKVPAQAGQREDRYTHTLCGAPDISKIRMKAATLAPQNSDELSELKERVSLLEQQVERLTEQLERLGG